MNHTFIWLNMDASFEWNERKDRQNPIKHGVSFFLAQEAFFDPCRVIAADLRHGAGEKRYFRIGRAGGGVLTVRFTWRGERIPAFNRQAQRSFR